MYMRALPPTTRCLIAWCTVTLSLEAAIESMTIRSSLEKLKSSSERTSGGKSSPNLSSLIWNLKKVLCGGNKASINLADNVTTHLEPTDCQGVSSLICDVRPSSFCMR